MVEAVLLLPVALGVVELVAVEDLTRLVSLIHQDWYRGVNGERQWPGCTFRFVRSARIRTRK